MSLMSAEYDYAFKIVIIGNSSVGKSSLLLRFADNTFPQSFLPTIGVDFKIRTITNEGSVVKLQMWDTAGQQKFKTIVSAYYKGAQGIILVFDLCDSKSFQDVKNWISQAAKYNDSAVRILVGNKCDISKQRQVKSQQAQLFADSQGIKYFQVSAKTNNNIQKVFTTLSTEMKNKFENQYINNYKKTTTYLKPICNLDVKPTKKSCC